MISAIGRAAIRRAGGNSQLATRVSFQLQRVASISKSAQLSTCSLARVVVPSRRFYATATATAGAPKTRARKTTASAAKNTGSKTVAKKQAKKAATKPVKKAAKKPVKKVLTEAEKAKRTAKAQKLHVQELRTKALFAAPKQLPRTAWMVLVTKNARKGSKATDLIREASAQYKTLSTAELESMNHDADINKETNNINYKKWVESHTPLQIKEANNARLSLNRIALASGSKKPSHSLIADDRQVKKPSQARLYYFKDKLATGDFKDISAVEAMKQIMLEWSSLPDNEKAVYEKREAAERNRYKQEYRTVYGIDPPKPRVRSPTPA